MCLYLLGLGNGYFQESEQHVLQNTAQMCLYQPDMVTCFYNPIPGSDQKFFSLNQPELQSGTLVWTTKIYVYKQYWTKPNERDELINLFIFINFVLCECVRVYVNVCVCVNCECVWECVYVRTWVCVCELQSICENPRIIASITWDPQTKLPLSELVTRALLHAEPLCQPDNQLLISQLNQFLKIQ